MSATPGRNARIDDILAELRRQGWRLEQGKDGSSYRCYPPDTSKQMIVISTRYASNNANGVVEILRHLRHQGFQWPPPDRERPAPIIRAVPFPPRPSPAVETVGILEVEPEPMPKLEPIETSELLFLELKEAKEYADLAAVDLKQAQLEAERAQRALEGKATHYREALAELKAKKQAFDEAFSAGGET